MAIARKLYLCLNNDTAEVIPLYNGSGNWASGGSKTEVTLER